MKYEIVWPDVLLQKEATVCNLTLNENILKTAQGKCVDANTSKQLQGLREGNWEDGGDEILMPYEKFCIHFKMGTICFLESFKKIIYQSSN